MNRSANCITSSRGRSAWGEDPFTRPHFIVDRGHPGSTFPVSHPVIGPLPRNLDAEDTPKRQAGKSQLAIVTSSIAISGPPNGAFLQ
jgi:hypothetical protein